MIPRTHTQKKKKKLHEKSIVHFQLESEGYTLHTKHNFKKKKQHLPPYRQDKKGRTLHSMTRLLISCMEILFLKLAAVIFGLYQ
jgi:hypothetical protein